MRRHSTKTNPLAVRNRNIILINKPISHKLWVNVYGEVYETEYTVLPNSLVLVEWVNPKSNKYGKICQASTLDRVKIGEYWRKLPLKINSMTDIERVISEDQKEWSDVIGEAFMRFKENSGGEGLEL